MGIQAGQSVVVIAGGTENISQLPYYIKDARWGARMGHKTKGGQSLSSIPTKGPETDRQWNGWPG